MPVSTPHNSLGVPHPVPQPAPKGIRGPMPARPSTKPSIEAVAASGDEHRSPPVEPNASNLSCSAANAGLSQPAPKRAGPRSGTPAELRARYLAENPEENSTKESSVYDGVSFDLSLPNGESWEDVAKEVRRDREAFHAAQAGHQHPEADPLPPTMRRQAAPQEQAPAADTRQDPSDAAATTPPPPATSDTYKEVDFALENDPQLMRELQALNDRYAPPPAKPKWAAAAAPARPAAPTPTRGENVLGRKRSASLGNVPRPATTGKEAPAKRASLKEEGGLRRLLKRWWSEPRSVGRKQEPKE